jgi:hypothetical protein
MRTANAPFNIAKIANERGADPRLVRQRMLRKGWTIEEAITRPKLTKRRSSWRQKPVQLELFS